MTEMIKKPELLAPAGSLEKLKIAFQYGADAVYFGGGAFSLRATAQKFTYEEMKEGVEYAHSLGKKIYCTVNIMPKNSEIDALIEHLKKLDEVGVDAVLVSDLGVLALVKKYTNLAIHISTQANTTNYAACNMWEELGAERVVLARESTLQDIKDIRKNISPELELEIFVHGAMCISYSGRCLLSSYMTGRDSNRGACAQSCRWKYSLVEEKRPNEYFPIEEDQHGTYIMNSKDLCMIDHIPELVDAGIDSFKIEGRMKTALYVATVARTYRMAIDDYFENPKKYEENIPKYKTLISQCTYRQYTTGFFFGKPDETTQIYDCNVYERDYVYLGISGEPLEDGSFVIEQKNKFCVGDKIEIMKADGRDIEANVISITDQDGVAMESCPHPKQIITIKLDQVPEAGDILRMKAE